MKDDDRVLETNWICLVRLIMLHCLSPTPPNFVSRNTRALLIVDDIWSLLSNAHKVGLCIESICFCVNLCGTKGKPVERIDVLGGSCVGVQRQHWVGVD